MKEERWTQGYPACVGYYDCRLGDGREEIVNFHPWCDSEIHPFGEILNAEILAFRRIGGMSYRKPGV